MNFIFSRKRVPAIPAPKPRIAVCGFSGSSGGDRQSGDHAEFLAQRLAARLGRSGRWHVIEHQWQPTPHPAHAAHLARHAGAHMVIVGHIVHSGRGNQGIVDLCAKIRAIAASTGETLAIAEARLAIRDVTGEGIDWLAETLAHRIEYLVRVAGLSIRASPPQMRILSAYGDMIVLEAGALHGLGHGARLDVHRVLEAVPDPCHRSNAGVLGRLSAKIGEADVLEVAERFAVAAYSGAQAPRSGDFAREARV